MKGDFSKGAGWLLKGISCFYRTPSLWKFALIPFLLTLLLYGILFLAAVRYGIPYLLDLLPDPEGHAQWVRWLIHPLRWLAALSCWLGLVLAVLLTLSSIYELLGAPFFDGMVVRMEREKYGKESVPLPFQRNLVCAFQSGMFSLVTLLLAVGLFFCALLLPVIGPLLMVLVIGYRMALTYLFSCGFNRGLGVREILSLAGKRHTLVLGFGTAAYLLLMVPFVSIFLIPAFVVSGILLYNEELEESSGGNEADRRKLRPEKRGTFS